MTYTRGLTYNAKGDLKWGDFSPFSYLSTAFSNSSQPGRVGASWLFNTSLLPTSGLNHFYAYIGETGPALDQSAGRWVDFGTVPGDENFLSPSRYEIQMVSQQLGGFRNLLNFQTIGQQWVDSGFNDMTGIVQVQFECTFQQVNPTQYPLGAGVRLTVTIRDKTTTETAVNTIDFNIEGIFNGNPGGPSEPIE